MTNEQIKELRLKAEIKSLETDIEKQLTLLKELEIMTGGGESKPERTINDIIKEQEESEGN